MRLRGGGVKRFWPSAAEMMSEQRREGAGKFACHVLHTSSQPLRPLRLSLVKPYRVI
jgi:hypothetical protein